MKMTHLLNHAIGLIQDTTTNWSAVLNKYRLDCRRYALKFGWSEAYEESAWCWGITRAAQEVLRRKARHEHILHPYRFLLSKMRSSLMRDNSGKLFIPRYRIEWRHGSGVEVSYSDHDLHIQEDFANAAR